MKMKCADIRSVRVSPSNFGTKESVASVIWVTACTSETTTPTSRATRRGGAPICRMTIMVSRITWATSSVCMPSPEA
jgi:hypothetical protein